MGNMQVLTSKSAMDISEKNKTKVMHRVIFRASNTVNDKVFQQLPWQQWRFKFAQNYYLIQFILETSSVTTDAFLY